MYKKRRRAMQKHRAKEKKYKLRRKLQREQAEAAHPTPVVRAPQPARSRGGGARAEA
jgi:hypothetical protein